MLWLLAVTLRSHRTALLLMGLGLAGIAVLTPHTYQAIGGPALAQMLEQLPAGFRAFMKAQGGLLLTSGPQGYIAVGLRHPFVLVIGSAFAIATASGAVAGQVGRRTILLVLARPVVRWRLLAVRIGETAIGLALLVGALLLGTIVGQVTAALEGVSLGRVSLAAATGYALFAAVAGYSYAISAATSDGGRATGLSAGLTVLFFLLDFLAGLWEPLEFLGPLSVFHYYDPAAVATSEGVPWRDLAVLGGVAVVGWGAALVIFQHRDIA